jgi:hypothetical protein
MMRRDDQANDQDDRSATKYQDHREDVLEDPVPACYLLLVLRRRPGLGWWMIAGGRIVQVEPSAAPAQAVFWVSSGATNPNHLASLPLSAQCSAVQLAEQAGLVTSRKVGNTRLVRANTASPYYAGLAEVLARAFGVPAVLAEALRGVDGITTTYLYGSWAARHEGQAGQRPVGDIDVLVLGEPDQAQLYAALSTAEQRLARPVQAAIRDNSWLESGSGAFHNTVTSRPLTRLPLPGDQPNHSGGDAASNAFIPPELPSPSLWPTQHQTR